MDNEETTTDTPVVDGSPADGSDPSVGGVSADAPASDDSSDDSSDSSDSADAPAETPAE